jgi:3-oxoacyl-[acyl-carrier-protein] synthase II
MTASNGSERQIVVTGIGLMSPIGIGTDAFWSNLSGGHSGIARATLIDFVAAPDNIVGEVSEFTVSAAKKIYLKKQRKSIKVMCREIQLGVASAMQAIEHAGIGEDTVERDRFGVDFGANLMFSPPEILVDAAMKCVDSANPKEFQFEQWGHHGLSRMQPLWLLCYLPNMPGCHIGIAADARGPNNSITLDDASANLVVGEACRAIQRDRADIMIAGSTGTRVHPVKSIHARMWDQLATSPADGTARCRPFELNRTGEVVGEGACSLILEEESHARARGATIYGRIRGSGASCVCSTDGTVDRKQALINSMEAALRCAGMTPDEIGHINANGTGARECDQEEAEAIMAVFGARATQIPVIGLKSYLGNSGPGAGSMELAGSLLSLANGHLPATLNYDQADPACPLNVTTELAKIDIPVGMSLSVTRMGQASVVIVEAA